MKSKKAGSENLLIIAGVTAALLVVVVGGLYTWNFNSPLSDSGAEWGQFGDFFGGTLNPLLSFFTFIVLLYTVSLQLQANREQLKANKESDVRHDEQMLDARLFQLLSVNLNVANGMRLQDRVSGELKYFEGITAASYVWNEFSEHYLPEVLRGDFPDKHEGIRLKMKILRRNYWAAISSYYDSVQFIIDFISRYGRDPEFTRFSLSALRSQMTIQGRALLFYVMIYSPDTCKFIPVLMAHSFWDDAVDDPLSEHRITLWKAAAVYHQA